MTTDTDPRVAAEIAKRRASLHCVDGFVSDWSFPTERAEALRAALESFMTYFGMDEDEWSKPTFEQGRRALATTPPQAEPSEIARLTAELADEKAVVDVLRSELQDRLQKQRAAEAELQEVRKDAVPEIDVDAAIAEGYRQLNAAQGTKSCVAFYRGAVWFREGLLAASQEATNGRPE